MLGVGRNRLSKPHSARFAYPQVYLSLVGKFNIQKPTALGNTPCHSPSSNLPFLDPLLPTADFHLAASRSYLLQRSVLTTQWSYLIQHRGLTSLPPGPSLNPTQPSSNSDRPSLNPNCPSLPSVCPGPNWCLNHKISSHNFDSDSSKESMGSALLQPL